MAKPRDIHHKQNHHRQAGPMKDRRHELTEEELIEEQREWPHTEDGRPFCQHCERDCWGSPEGYCGIEVSVIMTTTIGGDDLDPAFECPDCHEIFPGHLPGSCASQSTRMARFDNREVW